MNASNEWKTTVAAALAATLAEVAICKTPTKATPYFHLASN
jgi:hypothetical protein